MPEPEVLTIREVAAPMRVGQRTAYGFAQSGKIAGFEVGGQWRFRCTDIEAWRGEQTRDAQGKGGSR
jgi:excisionase family DNA binding protein